MGPKEMRQFAVLDDAAESLLVTAVRQMALSPRAYHRFIKTEAQCRTPVSLAVTDAEVARRRSWQGYKLPMNPPHLAGSMFGASGASLPAPPAPFVPAGVV